VDDLVRSWRFLLVAATAVAACGVAGKRDPVGVSNGGAAEHVDGGELGVLATAPLVGLPSDFRATWKRVAERVVSEHGRFAADVYTNADGSYAEDLFVGDAGAGVYLIERGDAGVRFAVADPRGRSIADDATDAGASLEPCVRCHRGATNAIFPPR
jgi:hypothetical protein